MTPAPSPLKRRTYQGSLNENGRLYIVDLLYALTSSDQLILILKNYHLLLLKNKLP